MTTVTDEPTTVRYRVTGMDCSDCVAKIEKATRKVSGVADVRVSLLSQTMILHLPGGAAPLTEVEQTVTGLGYQLDRLGEQEQARSHLTPGYKRALWIVIVLNVGYGLIEGVGGFLADSQALKADALDFVGDGLISFLGLLAIGWHLIWRARSALIQGVFLGVLGLGVIGTTIYRIIVKGQPDAETMGVLALIAFAVNVSAALVLMPHRSGDANMRAVWLFSRNDALGNLAVVFAAVLVFSTDSQWPDLAVAFVIASLFLQSSWSIVMDARLELAEGEPSSG